MYKFIIPCGRYRFFFLIVLQWFGHVFSNMGRFGHKRKLPGFLLPQIVPWKSKSISDLVPDWPSAVTQLFVSHADAGRFWISRIEYTTNMVWIYFCIPPGSRYSIFKYMDVILVLQISSMYFLYFGSAGCPFSGSSCLPLRFAKEGHRGRHGALRSTKVSSLGLSGRKYAPSRTETYNGLQCWTTNRGCPGRRSGSMRTTRMGSTSLGGRGCPGKLPSRRAPTLSPMGHGPPPSLQLSTNAWAKMARCRVLLKHCTNREWRLIGFPSYPLLQAGFRHAPTDMILWSASTKNPSGIQVPGPSSLGEHKTR